VSPPWRAELRAGLCPARIVLPTETHAVEGDAVATLARLCKGRRVRVVLSSHLVRYAVLPWSAELGPDEEWLALARHTFAGVYGAAADLWHCRVSPAGRGEPRLATAIDATLLDALRSVPGVISVQPYLMSAFNAHRRILAGKDGWLVLQEPGRCTVALIKGGAWRMARTRRIREDWKAELVDILERESAASPDEACEEVHFHGENEVPATLGRYRVTDVTAAPSRTLAMACH
jgi:hypothetical protein